MATRVRLFVSAGPDQDPAREMLGRALADLPINVGWVIKRTPDVESVAESHVFLILMGRDIWAPVGWELWWARRTEKPLMAYRQDAPRTPAGHVFLQEHTDLPWQHFATLTELRRIIVIDLGRFLLENHERYGLTVTEATSLRAYLERSKQAAPTTAAGAQGAGGGGIILAPGKDEPPGSRLVSGS
jgi:hypothetical protein